MLNRGGSSRGRGGPIAPIVKGVAAGIGLVSEYRHHRKNQEAAKAASNTAEYPVPDGPPPSDDKTDPTLREMASSNEHTIPTEHGETPEAEEAIDDDEKQWKLDDAQDELEPTKTNDSVSSTKKKVERDPAKMVKQFTDAHPPSSETQRTGISLPVVLPQRRPKNRTRGFIRAYAPELQNADIDQETFLEFIELFNTATLASPWLDAINLASFAFMALPTAIGQAAAIALAIAVDITKNMQSRHRHSYILDQMNTDFFRPRGLYALILTWNPDSTEMNFSIDINETVAKNLSSPHNLLDKAKHSFRPSMGNTVGTAFSQTAPLVFPVLDSLVNDQTPEAKEFKQKVKNAKSLVGEYFDRRAQAQHAGEHPDSQLAVTDPVFTSRYSDPNNPTNSGDVLALVTGGKVSMPQRGGGFGGRSGGFGGRGFGGRGFGGRGGGRGGLISYGLSMMNSGNRSQGRGLSEVQYQSGEDNTMYDRQRQTGQYQQYQNQMYQRGGPLGGFGGGPGNGGLIGGGIQRIFQHHVLYLAIINMPGDEEMATANEYLKNVQTQPQSHS